MNLLQLRIIDQLVNGRASISDTASKLYRVQSSISHQLKLLEEEFGALLFERKGKRLGQPTVLCRKLLPQMEAMLQAEKNIRSMVSEFTDENSGELRIATTHTQARYFLPEVIRMFRRRYPDVRLTFFQGNPSEFREMLKQGDIDFAVFSGEHEKDPSLSSLHCYRWNHVLITRHDHPLVKRQPLKLSDIASCPIVTYMPGFTERNTVQQAFSSAGLDVNVTCSAGDTEIIKTYVQLELGVGIVAQMAYDHRESRKLFAGSLDHLLKSSVTRIVYLKQRSLRAYMHEFIKILRAQGKKFQDQIRKV